MSFEINTAKKEFVVFDGNDEIDTGIYARDQFTILVYLQQNYNCPDFWNNDTIGTETFIGGNQGMVLRLLGGKFYVNDGSGVESVELGFYKISNQGFFCGVIFDRINGVLKGINDEGSVYATVDISGYGSIDNGRTIKIGTADNSVKNRYLRGRIWFIAMWERSLSDDEIKQVYDYVMKGTANMVEDGLIFWYEGDSFNEAEGKWYDKSGNGNDGSVTEGNPYKGSWLGDVGSGEIKYVGQVVVG